MQCGEGRASVPGNITSTSSTGVTFFSFFLFFLQIKRKQVPPAVIANDASDDDDCGNDDCDCGNRGGVSSDYDDNDQDINAQYVAIPSKKKLQNYFLCSHFFYFQIPLSQ